MPRTGNDPRVRNVYIVLFTNLLEPTQAHIDLTCCRLDCVGLSRPKQARGRHYAYTLAGGGQAQATCVCHQTCELLQEHDDSLRAAS